MLIGTLAVLVVLAPFVAGAVAAARSSQRRAEALARGEPPQGSPLLAFVLTALATLGVLAIVLGTACFALISSLGY